MSDERHQENEDRRAEDAERRDESREGMLVTENGEPVRIHVVSWINNTVWRLAVAISLCASLFSIYDNSARVHRLEGQVCDSLLVSEQQITQGSIAYYRQNPKEADAALERIRGEMRRFHCPEPDGPLG